MLRGISDNSGNKYSNTFSSESHNILLSLERGKDRDISKKYDEFNFLQRINEQTPLLSDDCYTIATKIYWILNDIQHFPICENDGKPLKGINVKNIANGYGKILACCKDCWNKIRHEHAKASNVKKYGASNPF